MTKKKAPLSDRLFRGTLWYTSGEIFSRGIGTIRLLIIASLLPQNELGLFGIAAVVINMISQLSQTGIRTAVIQTRLDPDSVIDTAWVSQVVRGVILSLFVISISGPATTFFGYDELYSLLLCLSLLPLIEGTRNAGIFLAQRELRYDRLTRVSVTTTVVELTVSVGFALVSPTAMALVAGRLAGAMSGLLTTYFVEPRRAKFRFSSKVFLQLYKFGFWIFVVTILNFMLTRGGDLVIGKLLTPQDLAVYQVAQGLACLPLIQIVRSISGTTFSAICELQDDKERLASVFLKFLSLTSFIAFLSLAGMCTVGRDFTNVFLPAEYDMVAWLLPPLAVWGVCRGLGAATNTALQAVGRPAMTSIFQGLMAVMFIALLIPMAKQHGLLGVTYSLMAIGLTAQIGRYFVVSKIIGVRLADLMIRILVPALVALVSSACAFAAMFVFESAILRFTVGTTVLVVIYGVSALAVDARMNFGFSALVESKLPRFVARSKVIQKVVNR